MNLYSYFLNHFPNDKNKTLLTDEEEQTFSYAYAQKEIAKFSHFLDKQGIKPGDRISVQVEKSKENLFLYLASLNNGLIYHPLNTGYTNDELNFFLKDAEPALVVCNENRKDDIKNILSDNQYKNIFTLNKDGSGTLTDVEEHLNGNNNTVACINDDIACLLYSSGTTGRPKGVMLSHENLRVTISNLVKVWEYTEHDVLLHSLPIYHAHGLFFGIGCALATGSQMIWHHSFKADKVIKDLPKSTVMMGVPTFYTRLLSHPEFTKECASQMRVFISGSAPLLKETFNHFKQKTGHEIIERYGLTETGILSSSVIESLIKPGSVGKVLKNISLKICDENGKNVDVNETGEVYAKGKNVFKNYWNLPEKTEEDFTPDGYFKTGDLAKLDNEGYLFIVGRSKDLIITGGLNVYPKEIEDILNQYPDIKESAVIGVPNEDFGEEVVAILETDKHIDKNKMILSLKEKLARFKVPKEIYILNDLPRNSMGKVQKNVLRDFFS